MPMSYAEMRKEIVRKYKANTNDWYMIVGCMFEATDGFTKYGEQFIHLHDKLYYVTWENYEWNIEEL